ncbi:Beta-glucuronosyltransferase GlcAT14B [Vitis vinifera]|uniref:Beta-glucuronosyltransferase GlcAT14B n=1 Tax=Vitis vinifera TaxID=29760 RepID=A0A438H4Z8_VITVI|nr:Beta-glucuronosyltransferase GlcAT14B [Vitis vinifera]
MGSFNMEKKWAFPLAISSLICMFLLATSFNMGLLSSLHPINSIFSIFSPGLSTNQTNPVFAEQKGDLEKLWRTLQVLYHPLNQYVVHLDLESPAEERLDLAARVEKDPIFSKVWECSHDYKGKHVYLTTVIFSFGETKDHLLVICRSSLHIFGFGPEPEFHRAHQSARNQRAMPLIVDPGLHMTTKSEIFWVSPRRTLPTAFKLFTGSAWMVLSRSFVEYCIWGWDNLPRTLLMYYANFVSSPEGYFQTVICNAPEYAKTTVNHDLHFISWDNPPKQHPHTLTINDTSRMIGSNAAFARKFRQDDPSLDKIDKDFTRQEERRLHPWWLVLRQPPLFQGCDPTKLKPGPGAQRLRLLVSRLLLLARYGQNQCK